MTYEIRFYRDCDNDYVLLVTCESLDDARALRQVSGDLVVDAFTDVVVDDSRWLWDWECEDSESYSSQQRGRHRPGKRLR